MPVTVGVFVLTGNPAGLLNGNKLSGDAGAFVLTGNVAAIYVGREVAAGTGVFVLTGNAAGLLYSSDAGVFVPRVVWFY